MSQDILEVKSLRTLEKQLDKFMGAQFIQGLLNTKCAQATECWRLGEYAKEISLYVALIIFITVFFYLSAFDHLDRENIGLDRLLHFPAWPF